LRRDVDIARLGQRRDEVAEAVHDDPVLRSQAHVIMAWIGRPTASRSTAACTPVITARLRNERTRSSAVDGATAAESIGPPYGDAGGTAYLPMFGQPVLVFERAAPS
jgi:hypothetical protein